MKPDEVINRLAEHGLDITRRTLLRYEKDELISEPYLRTGKLTEYAPSVVYDFIASWALIHGEYRLKPEKCKEVRKKSLQLLFNFLEVAELDFPVIPNSTSSTSSEQRIMEFVRKYDGCSFTRPIDIFVYDWIMTRQSVSELSGIVTKEWIMNGEKTCEAIGRIAVVADCQINDKGVMFTDSSIWGYDSTVYRMQSNEDSLPNFMEGFHMNPFDRPFIAIRIFSQQGCVIFKYFHPEDYYKINPNL